MLLSPSYLPAFNAGWLLATLVAIYPFLAIKRKRRSKMTMQFDTTGLESYLTDEDKERTGVWVDFPGKRAFKVLRAHQSNREYTRGLQAALKPYRRQLDKGTMDQDVSERILRDVFCKYIIIDWDGINDAEGNPVPYSRAAAIEFFTQFDELFDELREIASNAMTFGVDDEREVAEDLGEDLPGNSSTESRPRR